MKKLIFPLAIILGFIPGEVCAQTVIVRRPLKKVVVVSKPPVVIPLRPLVVAPAVLLVSPVVVVRTRPVIARTAPVVVYPPASSRGVVVRKTVIYKPSIHL